MSSVHASSDEWSNGSRRVGAVLLWVQTGAILAASVFYLVELARGLGDDRARVLMSVVVFLVGACGLAVLGRGLWHGATWVRTPVLVWHALLVPVAVSLAQASQLIFAVMVGAVALGGLGSVLLSSPGKSTT
ncbi:hypothetical protein [Austwickia sp. TVS 96-490-7B]|uniref:hypothetical protein n=1 Tax=Austwickia sp. TVS 96-490-7B TaxID=2830843 RepID=UPI001C56C471|nr:hypothetical protein [Austwickia sp. TVS 96-490-7B]